MDESVLNPPDEPQRVARLARELPTLIAAVRRAAPDLSTRLRDLKNHLDMVKWALFKASRRWPRDASFYERANDNVDEMYRTLRAIEQGGLQPLQGAQALAADGRAALEGLRRILRTYGQAAPSREQRLATVEQRVVSAIQRGIPRIGVPLREKRAVQADTMRVHRSLKHFLQALDAARTLGDLVRVLRSERARAVDEAIDVWRRNFSGWLRSPDLHALINRTVEARSGIYSAVGRLQSRLNSVHPNDTTPIRPDIEAIRAQIKESVTTFLEQLRQLNTKFSVLPDA